MTTAYTYTLAPYAYALPIMHAAAHPSSTVAGLLLGTVTGPNVVIDDAAPLVHRYASLSPTSELGIDLARAWAAKKQKQVVGVYVALGDDEEQSGLGRTGENLLKGVREVFGGAVGLALDTNKLTTSEPAFTTTGAVTFPDERMRSGALWLIRDHGIHSAIKDLDDHLDDARVDWLENKEVREAVAAIA